MPINPNGMTFCPLTNLWVRKLTHTSTPRAAYMYVWAQQLHLMISIGNLHQFCLAEKKCLSFPIGQRSLLANILDIVWSEAFDCMTLIEYVKLKCNVT